MKTGTIDRTAPGRAPATSYSPGLRALHWLMAAIIVVAIGIGFYCSYLTPGTQPRRFLLEIHKSLGMTAFFLLFVRLILRLKSPVPADRNPLGRLAKAAAHSAHGLLYALMIAMPVTGYLFSAAGNYQLPWFGLFQWPRLVPLDKELAKLGQALHGWGADILYIVLALHIAAVVWHRFVLKDGVLERMWPARGTSG